MRDHHVLLLTWAPELHSSTLELATRLASRLNAVLLFVQVVPCRPADGEAMLYSALDAREGRAEAWLRSLLPSEAGVRFRHHFDVGDPEVLVPKLVEAHLVDLVIAEEPPRSWVSRALWRSATERLVHQLPCPVVIGGPQFLRGDHAPPTVELKEQHPVATADLLNALVEARVEALRSWMDWQADATRRLLVSRTVESVLAVAASGRSPDARLERRLRIELDEHRRAHGVIGWQLSSPQASWTSDAPELEDSQALADFLQRVQRQGQSTSLPLRCHDAPERLVVLTGARTAKGSSLHLFHDAEDNFLRILGQPGPLPSLETYAFDHDGMMLSNSMFPGMLQEAGLLPRDGSQAPLRLRVAEPSAAPSDQWPLTQMAQRATQQEEGFNSRGYADYRGTPVVGAWRWVSEYGFGVTAEVDRRVVYGVGQAAT